MAKNGNAFNALNTSANDATDPLSSISRVSSDAQDSPFIEGEPDVGSFTIMRLPD